MILKIFINTGIAEVSDTLNKKLIALKEVKTKIKEISSVLLFDRIRVIQELPSLNSSLQMAFLGR